MSTFGGKIEEIPGISVDRFDENNLYSEAFFLSHCHTDHMRGLSSNIFQNILVEYNRFIYTSDISCVILKQSHSNIQNNIKVLDMYKPTLIMLKDKAISVTPLPAGHCPGSVMFLFESDIIVLYTGDYRINKSDFKKLTAFYNSLNEIKKIEKIYLDTTFFSKSYLTFPKRKDSLNELCKLIKEWIDKGKNHVIKLVTSANYGYEYVFIEIYKKIGMPVHVSYKVYGLYSIIPEMDNCVTLNGSLTQIHSNCGNSYQNICSMSSEVRTIKISAFRWTHDQLESGPSVESNGYFFVCYSTHASYEEGVELIRFLKPTAIEPCVKHDDPYFNYEMMQLLDANLSEFIRKESTDDKPTLFDTKVNPVERESDSLENAIDLLDDKYRILDSPPRESIQRLTTILKRHGSGIGLNKSYERVEIEAEKSKTFDFNEEFGISEENDMYELKESSKIETNIADVISFGADSNHGSTVEGVIEKDENVTISNTVEVNVKISLEMEKKLMKDTIHLSDDSDTECVKNNEKSQSDSNSFCNWIVNSSPGEKFKCEKSTTQDLNNLEDSEGSKSELETRNEKVEDGTNLLNQIFFLDSPPSTESATNENVSGNLENGFKSLDNSRFNLTQEMTETIKREAENGTKNLVNNLDSHQRIFCFQNKIEENVSIGTISRLGVTEKGRVQADNPEEKLWGIICISDSEDEDNNMKDRNYYPPKKKFK